MAQKITVTLSAEILQQLPQQDRENWIQAAIAEKLSREAGLLVSIGNSLTSQEKPELTLSESAESKAIHRLENPIPDQAWITVGSLGENIDLETINQLLQERGYAG
jgi:hypothetical protein